MVSRSRLRHRAGGRGRAARAWIGLLALACAAGASAQGVSEDEVKAGYLFNFVKFVEWPPESLHGPDFVIALLGSDSLSRVIERTLADQKVVGRRIVIKRCRKLEDAKPAQMVYIALSEESDLGYVVRELAGHNILTVGDSPEFAARGCIIAFETDKNRVHFHVNLASAERSGLKISSQLLKLATLISE